MSVRLDAIVFDAGTQVREAINENVVSGYAERMEAGDVFPPVVLFHDGNRYYMADGFHRGMAHLRIGREEIAAVVRPGTREDALWFALGANKANAHHMTASDKKHAILLALQTWPDRSSTQIAEQVGCTDGYVGRLRDQVHTSMNLPDRVTGKDGKSYPAARKTPTTMHTDVKPRACTKDQKTARWDRAREMAEQGYTSRQMADEFGVGLDGLRERLRAHAIEVPADRVIGKSKHHDSVRIVEHIVMDAENLTADVGLIDFGDLDRDRIAGWVVSLQQSRQKLGTFIRQLQKESQGHEAA